MFGFLWVDDMCIDRSKNEVLGFPNDMSGWNFLGIRLLFSSNVPNENDKWHALTFLVVKDWLKCLYSLQNVVQTIETVSGIPQVNTIVLARIHDRDVE